MLCTKSLFTNVSLETVILQDLKLNPIHWQAVNSQICRTMLWAPASHSFQPTGCCQSHHHHCSHTSMTVCGSVLMAPRPPFTPSSGALSQDATWGTPGCVLQSNPTARFVPGQAVACHAQVAPEEGSLSSWARGALGAAWNEHSQGGADSRPCRVPASWSQVCKLPSKEKYLGRLKWDIWNSTRNEHFLPLLHNTPGEELSLSHSHCPVPFGPAFTSASAQPQEQALLLA